MNNTRTKNFTTAGVLIATLLLVLAGCGGGGGSSGNAAASTVEVVACNTVTPSATVNATAGNAFSPTSVTIPANGVVQWTTSSNIDHTVTSGSGGTADGKFNEALNPGTSVCLKFTTAGSYSYFCTFHVAMGMIGSVTVQ